MPAATRVNDNSTGHPHCFPARPVIQGSPNVFCNGRNSIRVGDAWAVHGACPDHSPHGGSSSSGSGTVYINGKAAVRIGDAISCGDTVAEGSSNVFIGG